jgi:anthranilate/para-aminobenzoate synthase component I
MMMKRRTAILRHDMGLDVGGPVRLFVFSICNPAFYGVYFRCKDESVVGSSPVVLDIQPKRRL